MDKRKWRSTKPSCGDLRIPIYYCASSLCNLFSDVRFDSIRLPHHAYNKIQNNLGETKEGQRWSYRFFQRQSVHVQLSAEKYLALYLLPETKRAIPYVLGAVPVFVRPQGGAHRAREEERWRKTKEKVTETSELRLRWSNQWSATNIWEISRNPCQQKYR